LLDGSILIECTLKYPRPITKTPASDGADFSVVDIQSALVSPLHTMLTEQLHSDVTLLCGKEEKEIKAHKGILAAHSPVFRSMFEERWSESKEPVRIPDATAQTIHSLLRFLYCGTLDASTLDENYMGLLAIAEKYDISHLKSIVERFIVSKTTVSNALQMVELADFQNASLVKKAAIKVIVANRMSITRSAEWLELKKRNGALVDFLQTIIDATP